MTDKSSIAGRLAGAMDRRDEGPNEELAAELAASGDKEGIAELVALVRTGKERQRNDAIKVLYEIGARRPELIGSYCTVFLEALGSKANRQVWGAMTALDTVAEIRADEIAAELPRVIEAADRGSVIANEVIPRILEAARQRGLRVIDLHTPFLDTLQSLFPDGIHPNDEGHRIIANRIRDAIKFDPATGNYTVTLHKEEWSWLPPGYQTKEVKVEVTQQEIEDNLKRGGGSTVDNKTGTDKPIWPAVMETAYAKMHDDNPSDGLAEGYKEIDGGKAYDAMFAITGTEGENIEPTGLLSASMNAELMEKQISKALGEGRPVTLSTDPENRSVWEVLTGGEGKQDGLVDNHVYVVERVYKDSNGEVKVELRNPWSTNNNVGEGKDTPNATITVNLRDLIDTEGLEYVNVGPAK